ncbi:MAG: RND transporter, partial [Marivivens sp.]|nr:RND transporter [Marivivens sp.]
MAFLDTLPWNLVILACLTLGLAPFFPEPHIWEKLKMLAAGELAK